MLLLVLIGCCCWRWLKPKNDSGPYDGPYGGQDDHMNPMHPMNQAVGPPEDGPLGRSNSQRSAGQNSHHQPQYQHHYQGQSSPARQSSPYASPAAPEYSNNKSSLSSPAPAAAKSVSQPSQPRQQQLAEATQEPSYPTKQSSKQSSKVESSSVPEAVKYSQSVPGTTATAQQPSENNLVSIPSTRQAPKQAPQAEQMTQSDDEQIDHAAGPVFDGVLHHAWT